MKTGVAGPAALDDPEYASVRQAANLMAVSEETIRKLLTKGRLSRYKFFGRTLVRVSELRSLVRKVK